MSVPIKDVDQTKQLLPNNILVEILTTGLVVVGQKGTGKSIAGKSITSEIIKRQPIPIQCKLFDTALNWRWAYEPILYQTITDKTRFFYSGKEHILFDIELIDEREITSFISETVLNDFYKQRELKKQWKGDRTKFGWKLYCLEEVQSSLSRFALMRTEGRKMLKMISECRNFNQSFIIIGQRLANMSTSLVERCSGYLFGKMIGDNDLRKVRRICGKDSGVDKKVKQLADFGQFIYFNGSSGYRFNCPKYEVITAPREWVIKEEDKLIWDHFYGRRII